MPAHTLTPVQLFDAVRAGEIDLAAVPYESSHTGTVQTTLDAVIAAAIHPAHPLRVAGEYIHLEPHLLLGVAGASIAGIAEVRSHPDVMQQCAAFLDAHLPAAKRVIIPAGTGAAASQVMELGDASTAAIAGPAAETAYPTLKRLHPHGIERPNGGTIFTKIWLLSAASQSPVPERHLEPRTCLLVRVPNRPGALHRVLACFALRDVNVAKFESRPHTAGILRAHAPWEYALVLEVDGAAVVDTRVAKAVENLTEFCTEVSVLGAYPRYLVEMDAERVHGIVGL